MNKQEIEKAINKLNYALELIGDYEVHTNTDGIDEAIELAISALTQQLTNGWIPVSERLPEEKGWYVVTVNYKEEIYLKAMEMYFFGRTDNSSLTWDDEYSETRDVIAWQPLPEPWKGDNQE